MTNVRIEGWDLAAKGNRDRVNGLGKEVSGRESQSNPWDGECKPPLSELL